MTIKSPIKIDSLQDLLHLIRDTKRNFPDEFQRCEFLAHTRAFLDGACSTFAVQSPKWYLATAVIETTKRLHAKNLRFGQLRVIEECLKAMAGNLNCEEEMRLAVRLEEIN